MPSIERSHGYTWTEFWATTRSILRHEYELRRVPRDAYREQWFLGKDPVNAARAILLARDPTAHEISPRGHHQASHRSPFGPG